MSIGAGGVIDQLWIALGIKADDTGFRKIRGEVDEAKSSLLSMGTALSAFVTGFAVKQVADIGNYFEQARIDIGGFYNALGMSSDFNTGLTMADETMHSIVAAAAAMPGEANDFIQVFKLGLPFVREALGKNSTAADIAAFTNKLTGTMISPELPASVIGSELEMLLGGQGRASVRLTLFQKLGPLMRELPGQAKLTAASFNQMTQAARFDLINQALDKMGPALEAKKHTFDAVFGAVVSDLKMITLATTKPMFEGMKKGLDQINNLLFDEKGKPTVFGQHLLDDIGAVMRYLTQFLTMGADLVKWFATSKIGAAALKAGLILIGTALAGLGISKAIGLFKNLFGVMLDMESLLKGGLFLAIGLIAEDLYQFYTGGNSVTGLLVDKFAPALMMVKAALQGLITLWVAVNVNPFVAAIYGAFQLGRLLAELIDKMGVLGLLEPKALRDFHSPEHFDRSGEHGDAEDNDTSFLQKRAPMFSGRKVVRSGAVLSTHSSGMHSVGGWTPADKPSAAGSSSQVNNVNSNNNQKIDIKIDGAKDPKAVAKETHREIVRASGSGVKL